MRSIGQAGILLQVEHRKPRSRNERDFVPVQKHQDKEEGDGQLEEDFNGLNSHHKLPPRHKQQKKGGQIFSDLAFRVAGVPLKRAGFRPDV
jgi:hypothetical protein